MTTINIGANTYQIHGTEGGANTYFGGQLASFVQEWLDASSTERKQALVMAANWMARFENNRGAQWTGEKSTGPTQVLPWPRDNATCNGEAVPDGSLPTDVVTGEYELALALLKDPTIQEQLTQGSNVRRARGGSAEVEFFNPSRNTADDTPVPAIIWQLFGCYFSGGGVTPPTVTGNECPSSFDESPSAPLSQGYA